MHLQMLKREGSIWLAATAVMHRSGKLSESFLMDLMEAMDVFQVFPENQAADAGTKCMSWQLSRHQNLSGFLIHMNSSLLELL